MENRANDVVSSVVSSVSNRRSFVKLVAGAGALALVGATSLPQVAGAQSESSHYRTTSALNLRQKPSTSSKVLLVMPEGALVQYLGEKSKGFFKVAYQGSWGWAHSDYLTASNGGSADPGTIIGKGITTDAVNFRTGPSTGHSVIQVLPKGTVVSLTDRVEYNFRVVEYNGRRGYVHDDYLANDNGGGGNSGDDDGATKFKTTTAVNLRSRASTSSKVLLVVPKGATVLDYDLVMANGFRGVDYKGTVGWIYDDYLVEV